jgi:UDPglucose 6-dehydrogenase
MADSVGANSDLARTTDRLNRAHPLKLADKMETLLPAGLENPIIAILGLAYKPDTDVVEESEGVALAKLLCERGYSVMVYDPLAIENAKKVLGPQVEYAPSAQAAVSRADLTVICTPWNEFRNLGPELFKNTAHIPVLLDCWRMYGKHAFGKKVRYFAVGRSASQPSVVSAQGRRETARSSLSLDTAPTLS